MQQFSAATKIWNRACAGNAGTTQPGDLALSCLLRFHSLAMNGGVLHAAEVLSGEELMVAEWGYRFFGLASASALVISAAETLDRNEDLEAHEAHLDDEYLTCVPSDATLFQAFELRLLDQPTDFAPVL